MAFATAEATAGDGDADRSLKGATDVDFNGLVVVVESIAKVVEVLAVVDDGLAANLEGEDALGLVAVGVLAESVENGTVLDGGAHEVLVDLAGADEEVVNENGADFGAEEVVMESHIALQQKGG